MNYRRRYNRRQARESSFLRNWKFETPKETLGKLIEWAGAGLGLVAGTAAAKHGIPLPPTVVSGAGVFLGVALGAVAKAALNAGLDAIKSRPRPQDPAAPPAAATRQRDTLQGRQPARLGWITSERRTTRRGPQLGRTRRGGASGSISAGSLIAEMEQIIAMIERTHQDLTVVIGDIRNNHAWLMTVLVGASPTLLQRISGQSSAARAAVEEACTLLRLSKDDLRGYLRTI